MGTPAIPGSLLAMLDELEQPQLERLARVLRAKLRPAPLRREERDHELGVLNAMLDQAGLLKSPRPRIARRSYDDDRPERAPRSATLVARYGSWFKACRAAAGLDVRAGTKDTPRPWSSKHRSGYRGPNFTRQEVIDAVLQCAAAVDRVPSSNVYYDWSARERRKARERGGHLPRLPAQASVERHFSGWAEVRAVAIAQLAGSGARSARR